MTEDDAELILLREALVALCRGIHDAVEECYGILEGEVVIYEEDEREH